MGNKEYILTDEVLTAEYEAVYRFVLSLTRNESDARDVTQETFLKALRAPQKYGAESSLYTWLCAVAKNVWRNELKKRSKTAENADNAAEDSPDGNASVEDLLDEKELSVQIHKVLHSLNDPYKEVFSLRVFGGLSFELIGKIFSKTDSWARVTYYRARKMITEKLRKEGII